MESPTSSPPSAMEPGGSDTKPDTSPQRLGFSSSSHLEQSRAEPSRQSYIPASACLITGASHKNLLDFGIHVCPRCNLHIIEEDTDDEANAGTSKDVETLPYGSDVPRSSNLRISSDMLAQLKSMNQGLTFLARKAKKELSGTEDEGLETPNVKIQHPTSLEDPKAEDENGKTSMANPIDINEARKTIQHQGGKKARPSGIYHEVLFTDSLDYRLHVKPWDGPFDLAAVRKGVEARETKTIAQVTTILVTDIQGDDERSERERVRITKAGFFNNPRVGFISMRQKIIIESKQVIAALRKLVKYYPSVRLQAEPFKLWHPFYLIAHHMTDLEEYKEALSDKRQLVPALEGQGELSETERELTVNHLGQLLEFMKTNIFSRQLEAEQARHAQSLPVCTFSMLWLLYKPGTTVYVKNSSGKTSAYILETVDVAAGVSMVLERSQPYCVTLWSLSFDGNTVRRSIACMTIVSFDGERPITDLKIVPASFIDAADGGKTRRELIQRGKKWYGMLTGAQQWHYSGETLDKKTLDTKVVIDITSYYRTNRGRKGLSYSMGKFDVQDMGEGLVVCSCDECLGRRPHPPKGFPWAEYDLINPKTDDLYLPEGHSDRDHRFLLCVGFLVGFALKTRTWEQLDVELCKPAKVNEKAIETLVMPDERKRMIKAMVQTYTDPKSTPENSTRGWGADFIQTKGEGQIFLLHGGPGVGKTYTAECIAELIGRPLLSLTCADLGTDEESMEKRLSWWFKLAESWGAVFLLDEADVWLERRMVADLSRNILVAVFLRCLEYYRGILFLTSNRVGTFDDAFISRIHVVIYYEDLGEPQRKQIWKQFFDKLERERKDSIIVESRAKHFVLNDSEMRKIPWNGREIRNAFQTAVSLAEYRFHFEGGKEENDKIVLDKMDFEQVCQMSLDFKAYLTKVHSGDDEKDRAMRERARA